MRIAVINIFIKLQLMLVFVCALAAVAQTVQIDSDRLRNDIQSALDAGDRTAANSLVKQHRYQVNDVIVQLLDDFLRLKISRLATGEIKEIDYAERIARMYGDLFQQQYFSEKVALYRQWTMPQIRQKMVADSFRTVSAENYDNNMLENAREHALQALRIYRELGDIENEASCLKTIGIIYRKLPDYAKSDSSFQRSLDLYKRIDNKVGLYFSQSESGTLYKIQRQYEPALNAFQTAMKLAEEMGNKRRILTQWLNLGATYTDMAQYDIAIDCLQKALQLTEENRDDDLKVLIFQNLVGATIGKNDFHKAIEYGNDGLQIAKKLDNYAVQGALLTNMSVAHRNLSQFNEALEKLKQALVLNQKRNEFRAEANTLTEIGIVFFYLAELDSSLAYWQRALKIFEAASDSFGIGYLTGYIGVYYKNVGQPYEALKAYQKALKLVSQTGNKNAETIVLGNIGDVYSELLADYLQAEHYYKQSLEIEERTGRQKSIIGQLLHLLGNVKRNQGNYQASLGYYYRALQLARETGHRSSEAALLGSIGSVYLDLRDPAKGIEFLERNLAIIQETGEEQSRALVLNKLGLAYNQIEADSLALYYFQQAKYIAKIQNQPPFLIDAYLYLGNIYQKHNKVDESLAAYDSALTIAKHISDLMHQVEVLTALGDLKRNTNAYDHALENYQTALNIAQRIQAPEQVWKAQYGISSLLEVQGKKEESLQWYDQAIETIESIRGKITLESLKESFLVEKLKVYSGKINLLIDSGEIGEAFNTAERAKARNLLDIVSTGHIKLEVGISPELLQKKQEAEWRLSWFNQQLNKAYAVPPGQQNRAEISAWQDSLKETRFRHEQVLQEIRLNHPRYAEASGLIEPLTYRQIQKKIFEPLDSSATGINASTGSLKIIDYFVSEHQTFVWVFTKDTLFFERLDLPRDSLRVQLQAISAGLFSESRTVAAENSVSPDHGWANIDIGALHRLYNALFQPLARYLQPGDELIIIPSDLLHYLPLEMLVSEFSGDRVKYLIEDYAVSYANSVSLLDPALFHRETIAGEDLLAFGNPDFGAASLAPADSSFYRGSPAFRNGQFAPLPFSGIEVREIAKNFTSRAVFTGKSATEEALKQRIANYRCLHISTHNILFDEQPMYSQIVLTQPQRIDSDSLQTGEDGFLHTYEVFNLSCPADMVVLSVCESGRGKLSRGEGLIGATQAFFSAGARSLVVSQWAVEDRSTSELMKKFYGYLKQGLNKRRALQQAKIELIRSGEKTANAFYWAPFVLIGDGSAIAFKKSNRAIFFIIGLVVLVLLAGGYFLRRMKSW